MKNIIKLIGIIALVAVIGFSFTACGDDDDDKGGGGTFTLTNIPSEHNGKLMIFGVDYNGEGYNAWGNMESDLPYFFVLSISNGRASIPVWEIADDGVGFQRFTSTGTFDCGGSIQASLNSSTSVIFDFYSVSFTNGSATKSWNDAIIRN